MCVVTGRASSRYTPADSMVEARLDLRVARALLILLGVSYVAWAAVFIARSAIMTDQGRYFCLFDDAMVSLRYAWNLAHGAGLVWNPGERVEGITSLAWTLYMSLGSLVFDKSAAVLFVQ